MNKKLFIFFTLLFFFTPWENTQAAVLASPPNNLGMILYWTLDGKDMSWSTGQVTDRSGNNRSGLIASMPTTTASVSGKIGQALTFDGTSSYIRSPDMLSTLGSSNPLTISLWFKATAPGIIIDENSASDGSVGTWHDTWLEVLSGGTVKVRVWNCTAVTIGTVSFGTWNHVVLTYTSGSLGGAVNGVTVTPGSCTRTLPNTASIYYYLGLFDNQSLGSSARFSGAMDDVRIYNRALSSSEITRLYNAGSSVQSASLPSFMSSGLVGYWTMDGKDTSWTTNTMTDRSGRGNTARFVSLSTTTSATLGKIGQALNFNGINQYITVSDSSSLRVSALTVSAWVKLPSVLVRQNIVSKFNQSGNVGWLLEIDPGDCGTYGIDFAVGSFSLCVTGALVSPGVWQHIVATYNGTTKIIYVNGVAVGNTSTNPGAITNDANDLNIATFNGARNLVGSVDEVRVYNRVLTSTEVAQLYQSGGGAKTGVMPANKFANGGLVGYWSFNGKDINWATGVVADGSGSGNTGNVIGMSTTSSPIAGKVGQALSFVGGNYVTMGNASSLNFSGQSEMTISTWVKLSGTQSWPALFAKQNAGTGQYSLVAGQGGANRPALYLTTVNNSWAPAVLAGTVLSAGVWYHVAATYDGTNTRIYINGVLDNSATTFTGAITSNTTVPVTIGIANNLYTVGTIDETRVYNRALSAAEIKALYAQGR